MVLWFKDGPHGRDVPPEGEAMFRKALDEVINDVNKTGKRVTIKEFYDDYLKCGMGYLSWYHGIEPEVFVDPDEYGFSRAGFRRLYKIGWQKLELELPDIPEGEEKCLTVKL